MLPIDIDKVTLGMARAAHPFNSELCRHIRLFYYFVMLGCVYSHAFLFRFLPNVHGNLIVTAKFCQQMYEMIEAFRVALQPDGFITREKNSGIRVLGDFGNQAVMVYMAMGNKKVLQAG